MDDLCLHETNIKSIVTTLSELAKSGKRYRLIIKIWKDKRTIDQNSLSHMWYDDLAKQANVRMKTNNYTMKSVKHDLKEMFLGYEDVEHTNLLTGEITVKQQLRKTSKLDIGEMHFYLQQIEVWASQNGFRLRIPSDSEYQKLKIQQVA